MTRNIIEAGHERTIYDVDASAIAGLVAYGASAAGSVGKSATGSDIVIIWRVKRCRPRSR